MSWGTISGGPINFGVWNSLYPFNYMTNYGGQFQYCTMPMGISAQEAFEVQNVLNVPFQLGRLLTNYAMIPYQMQAQGNSVYAQQGAAIGAAMGSNIVINARVTTLAGNISSVKSQIEQALKHDGLNTAQKAELEKLKKEAEDIEKELEALQKERQNGATDEEVKQKLTDLENKLSDFTTKVKTVGDKITEELSQSTSSSESGSTSGSSGSSGSSEAPGSSGTSSSGNHVDTGYDDSGRSTALAAAPQAKDVRNWCDKFNASINDRWMGIFKGTDDPAFEACLDGVNESNVIEYIEYYDKNYGGKGLISDFINDATHKQLVNFVPKFLNALLTRAETLGIEDDIAQETSKIHKELKAINISESRVIRHLKNIAEAIKAAEAQKAQEYADAQQAQQTE